jgi:two-component system cell cycle sensor histidine kinase/response regulator CckA
MPDSGKDPERVSVVLVDDEGAIRYLLSHWLKEAGYTPLLCSTAREALELFSREQRPPALLVTDVRMPEVSGTALAEEVCRHRPDLPVVFISGYVQESDVVSNCEVRRLAFLAKPFGREAFLDAVRGMLEGGRNASATHAG